MPAYSVHAPDDFDREGCVVFAGSDVAARRRGMSELNLDEMGGMECIRAPWADQYEAEGKVPAAAMIENGWSLICSGCDQQFSDYACDSDDFEYETEPVGHQHAPYCTPACRARDAADRARKRRGERRFWSALKREALYKLPGATIEPDDSPNHHRYFGHHSKSGRDRAICFVVAFRFPGARWISSYRYDLGYEEMRGRRQVLVPSGDHPEFHAWRGTKSS